MLVEFLKDIEGTSFKKGDTKKVSYSTGLSLTFYGLAKKVEPVKKKKK